MQAASALRSLFVWSAKTAKSEGIRIGDRRRIVGQQRRRDRLRVAQAGDHVRAKSREDGASHALRMRKPKKRRDARAHGIANDVGLSMSR